MLSRGYRPTVTSAFAAITPCCAATPLALTTGNVVRGPATAADDDDVEVVVDDTGIIELNAARAPVTATPDFDPITSVRVDTESGVMGGYASFAMDADLFVPLGTTVGSAATGLLSLEASIDEPEPGDALSETEFGVLASAGIVGFSATASLRIVVPQGLTLVGSDALLDNIVVSAPVPLPAAGWLFGAALSCLPLLRGLRQQGA